MELRNLFVAIFFLSSTLLVAQDSRFGEAVETDFSVDMPFFSDGIYIVDLINFSVGDSLSLSSVENKEYIGQLNYILAGKNLDAILDNSSYFDVYGNEVSIGQVEDLNKDFSKISLDYAIVKEGAANVFIRYEIGYEEELKAVGVVELIASPGKVVIGQNESSELGFLLSKTLSKNALYRLMNRKFLSRHSPLRVFSNCLRPFPNAGVSFDCVFDLINNMTLSERKTVIVILNENN